MRRLIPCLALLGAGWLLVADSLWSATPSSATVVNQIILRVNSRIATLEDYERSLMERRRAILTAEMDPEDRQGHLDESGRIVFRDLYEELLLLSRADQLGFQVSEGEVAQAVQQSRQRMGIETQEEFLQGLAASGITGAELRDRLRRNLLMQQVVSREVQARIDLDDEELRRVYRQRPELFAVPEALKLQQIVVLSTALPSREGRLQVAEEILAELAAGTTLADVAEARSTVGQTTGLIDLGWVEKGDLAPELEAAAWGLDAGDTSQPVEARGGTHILEIVERRAESLRPFEEVRDRLAAFEGERRMSEELPRYLEELAGRAYVVMRAPPEAEGFRGFEPRDAEDSALEEALGVGSD